jgi:hypothetical protein
VTTSGQSGRCIFAASEAVAALGQRASGPEHPSLLTCRHRLTGKLFEMLPAPPASPSIRGFSPAAA